MLSITATVVGGAGGIWARPNPCPPPPWLQVCTSSVVTNMALLLSKSFGGTVDRYSIAALSAAFLQLLSLSVRALDESSTDSWQYGPDDVEPAASGNICSCVKPTAPLALRGSRDLCRTSTPHLIGGVHGSRPV